MRAVRILLLLGLLALAGCAAPAERDVIRFDLAGISEEGLAGSGGGRVAVDYEFCIPDLPENRATVRGLDPSVRFMEGARGRAGCGAGQVLCIGSTHQPRWRDVLRRLARLPWIARIERCHWE